MEVEWFKHRQPPRPRGSRGCRVGVEDNAVWLVAAVDLRGKGRVAADLRGRGRGGLAGGGCQCFRPATY
jgi:hypothetical protein